MERASRRSLVLGLPSAVPEVTYAAMDNCELEFDSAESLPKLVDVLNRPLVVQRFCASCVPSRIERRIASAAFRELIETRGGGG